MAAARARAVASGAPRSDHAFWGMHPGGGANFPMAKLMNTVVELPALDPEATVEVLNRILHLELNGVMQQYHHAWMSRSLQASRPRAIAVGEHIAALTG